MPATFHSKASDDLLQRIDIDEQLFANRSLNWNSSPNGPYLLDTAVHDFGNVKYGWKDNRVYISNGMLRVTFVKDSINTPSGMVSSIDIVDGLAYELNFQMKFHSQFSFVKRGKVGFGLLIGDGNVGGDIPVDGNGGSIRLMWETPGADTVLIPYLYHYDQTSNFGESFGKRFPQTGSLVKGQLYTIKMYVEGNNGITGDGRAKIIINDSTVLDTAIRWTTNNEKRFIKHLVFSNFRDGETYFGEARSKYDSYIYFDNLSWLKLW